MVTYSERLVLLPTVLLSTAQNALLSPCMRSNLNPARSIARSPRSLIVRLSRPHHQISFNKICTRLPRHLPPAS